VAEQKAPQIDPAGWVDNHGDVLFRYALLRLRDSPAAEEVVQETFLAALKSRDSFSGRSSERTWLVGILKHKIVDYIRRRIREHPAAEADTSDFNTEEPFDGAGRWKTGPARWRTDPAVAREMSEFQQVFNTCMENLPERQADAFTLREMEELSSEEICKVLGISETNLWVMLHRARQRLRGCIDEEWSDRTT
jgi:RNA polymerase sigma-70 factor (TIGR02943 family)